MRDLDWLRVSISGFRLEGTQPAIAATEAKADPSSSAAADSLGMTTALLWPCGAKIVFRAQPAAAGAPTENDDGSRNRDDNPRWIFVRTRACGHSTRDQQREKFWGNP